MSGVSRYCVECERLAEVISDLRAEAVFYQRDAETYRTAIEAWHDLSRQKNLNGPDGPTDEWLRAVDALRAIATGESA